MIGFSYDSKPLEFRTMSFFDFLSQKTYPGEFSRPEVVWNRSYQRKSSIWKICPAPICHFLKMPYIQKSLELKDNFFRIFISLSYLPLAKISKKSVRYGWHVPENVYDLTWNYPIKNVNLTDTNYHWKIKLAGYLILGKIKFCNFKSECFEKKRPKS